MFCSFTGSVMQLTRDEGSHSQDQEHQHVSRVKRQTGSACVGAHVSQVHQV